MRRAVGDGRWHNPLQGSAKPLADVDGIILPAAIDISSLARW